VRVPPRDVHREERVGGQEGANQADKPDAGPDEEEEEEGGEGTSSSSSSSIIGMADSGGGDGIDCKYS
jgi:hypothetical protein